MSESYLRRDFHGRALAARGALTCAGVLALGLSLDLAADDTSAQPQGEQKVVPVLPHMQDIKTVAPVMSKPAEDYVRVPTAAPALESPAPKVDLPPELAGARLVLPDEVMFDTPGDGSLWAGSPSYKAQFAPNAATYIPFLGSDAPQNYPLSFSVQSMTVGGKNLNFNGSVAATRNGNVVSYDRGSFTEVYELTAGSVEQKFVFDSLPAGDLTVLINAQTELAGAEQADKLAFTNERGAVNYGKATVLDAAGHSAPAATTFNNGAIEIQVPHSFIASAQFPVTIDPVITTFSVDTTTSDDHLADIAYDDTNNRYMMCWARDFSATDSDVHSVLYTSGGTLVAGSFVNIDFTTDTWHNPKCANNNIADQFLVVAQVGVAPGRIIRGRTREADSNVMGAQFTISADPTHDQLNPDVGGDPVTAPPTHYCVVWERVFTAGTDNDIHARLVLANSTLVGPGTILIDNTGATLDRFPAVAKSDGIAPFSTQEWPVVWQRRFDPTDEDIRGAQIHWDGTITHPSFSVDFSSLNHTSPTVSSIRDGIGARPYMVVYEENAGSGDRDMRGRVLTGNTSNAVLTLVADTQDHVAPSADCDGSKFIVAWSEQFGNSLTDYDIWVSTFCYDGVGIRRSEYHRNLAFSGTPERFPEVASQHSGGETSRRAGAVWNDAFSSLDGDIEAGIYEAPIECNCWADIAAPFGVVDVNDLLAVIGVWGSGGINNPADITGDRSVDVNDLLAVVGQWGPCP